MKTKSKAMTEAVPRRDLSLFDEMDRLFDTLTQRGWLHPFREVWPESSRLEQQVALTARVDLVDREAEILVRAELPGIDRNELNIELAGDLLTIKGERKLEETKEEEAYFRSEIATGMVTRTIRLPAAVAAEDATAEFKDGVLEIHLPKAHKTERRRIEVA